MSVPAVYDQVKKKLSLHKKTPIPSIVPYYCSTKTTKMINFIPISISPKMNTITIAFDLIHPSI